MVGIEFFGNVDLASVAIWAFWLFFALLVYYLQTENMREGYPLEEEDGSAAANQGPFPLPKDKTFILRDGQGTLTVPSEARGDRIDLPMVKTEAHYGAPFAPTGDPMLGGVGPASWAPRKDDPELDAHGHPKIKRMSDLPDFHVAAGRDPRGKAVVAGDGEAVGRVVDMMVDIPEQLVRYLVIDVNPEGTGKIRLAPFTMTRIKNDRVKIRSLYSGQFDDIPQTASPSVVTKLEEDKIMGWFGGGTMYADPKRAEPKL